MDPALALPGTGAYSSSGERCVSPRLIGEQKEISDANPTPAGFCQHDRNTFIHDRHGGSDQPPRSRPRELRTTIPNPVGPKPLDDAGNSTNPVYLIDHTIYTPRMRPLLVSFPCHQILVSRHAPRDESPPSLVGSEISSPANTPSPAPCVHEEGDSGCNHCSLDNAVGSLGYCAPSLRNETGVYIMGEDPRFIQRSGETGNDLENPEDLQQLRQDNHPCKEPDWVSPTSSRPKNRESNPDDDPKGVFNTTHASVADPWVLVNNICIDGHLSHQGSSENQNISPPSGFDALTEPGQGRISPKRVREQDGQGGRDQDDNDDSDDDPSPGKPTKKRKGEDRTKPFACPFYRRDPYHQMECMNYRLMRVRDVKQHLQRKHYQPSLYCPSCYQTFPLLQGRDDHIRSRSCRPRPPTMMDGLNGVSQEAQARLTNRVDRSLTPVDQWFDIWNTLFPDDPRPKTPYLGTIVEENFLMVRELWDREGHDIVSDLLRARVGDVTSIEGVFSEIMKGAFDQVQDRLEQRVQGVKSAQSPDPAPESRQNSLPMPNCSSERYSSNATASVSLSSSGGSESLPRNTSPPIFDSQELGIENPLLPFPLAYKSVGVESLLEQALIPGSKDDVGLYYYDEALNVAEANSYWDNLWEMLFPDGNSCTAELGQ